MTADESSLVATVQGQLQDAMNFEGSSVEKQVRALEREIEKQEQLSAQLDTQIEAAASDYQELARLMEEKQQAEDTLAQMMEQWEALSCELEDAT